jgi:VCBS repeat-containing protein
MTTFTMTSPVGGALPTGVTAVGGFVFDIVGLNGARIVTQLAAGGLFNAYTSATNVIGTLNGFTPQVVAAMGGGIAQLSVRLTLWDGDTATGDFDHNQDTLTFNGLTFSNLSGVATQTTTNDGVTAVGTSDGFANDQLSTGWMTNTNQTFLTQFYNSLVSNNKITVGLNDATPGENYLDFTQGVSGGLINVGQPPNVSPLISSVTNSGPANEASSVTVTVAASDPDASPGGLTYAFDFNNDGTYDTTNATGSATHTFADNGTYTVGVKVTDSQGGQTSGTTTIVVKNVAPVVSPVSLHVGETAPATTVALAGVDPSPADTLTYQIVSGPSAGTLVNNGNGTFSFNPGPAFHDLGAGETRTVTFSYTATDDDGGVSAPAVGTVVVTGVNDGPVLVAGGPHALLETAATTGSAATDTVSATLSFTDADLSDHHTASAAAPVLAWSNGAVPSGVAAALTNAVSATVADSTSTGAGSVTATLAAADKTFDFLAEGETLTVTSNVTVNDGHGGVSSQAAVFVVTGSNDAPVLTASSGVELIKNGGFDQGGASWTNTNGFGIEVNPTGTYGVSPGNNAVMELDTDNGYDDVRQSVATAPGATYTFSFDTALRGGTSPNDNAFQVVWNGAVIDTVTASSTSFEHHTYTVNSAGSTGTVEFRELISDGLGGIIDNVSLKGPASIAEATGVTGSSALDSVVASLRFTDVDLDDHHLASVSTPTLSWTGGANPPASLAASLTGALTTTVTDSTGSGSGSLLASFSAPDKSFDFLAQGESLTVTYSVTVSDGHGGASSQPVTITVTGSNDQPVLSADAGPHAVAEAMGVTGSAAADVATATLAFTDVDLGDHHTASVSAPVITWSTGAAAPGGLAATLANSLSTSVTDSTGTGAGSVTAAFSAPDSAFDFLAQGETLTVKYTVVIADGHGGLSSQPVTITVTGANDGPLLAVDAGPHAIVEAAGVTGSTAADVATTTLSFTDVDLNDHHVASVSAPVVIWSGGSALPNSLAATLGGALTTTMTDSSGTGAGSLTANFSAPDQAFDFLAQGETLTVTYSVTVDDGHGGLSSQPVTITVTGANDRPTLDSSTVSTGTITEQSSVVGSNSIDHGAGVIAFHDADLTDRPTATVTAQTVSAHNAAGAAFSVSAAQVTAFEAAFQLAPAATNANDGALNWTYGIRDGALDFLGSGETVTVTSSVLVDDHHGGQVAQNVTLTLVGADDAPAPLADIIGVQKNSSVSVDAAHGVLSNDNDVDLHDSLNVGAVNGAASGVGHSVAGAYGSLTMNADGSYRYVANTSPGALPAKGAAQDIFTYTANDGHGGTTVETLTVTVYNNGSSYQQGSAAGGANGSQVLDAGLGSHALVAGNGSDILIAGWGSTTMTGGKGPDTFVFSHADFGSATVTDFRPGEDLLQFDDKVFATFGDVLSHASQSGANVVISVDAADQIVLQNVSLTSLHSGDFLFT